MEFQSTKNYSTNQLKMLIYGPSGSGKTTLAKTIKEPTLIINGESGLLSLADSDIPVWDLSEQQDYKERYAKLLEVYTYLSTSEEAKQFKWIFIDSLTEIAQILIANLKHKIPDRKDAFVMWGEYTEKLKAIIKAFRDLKGYHVVFTALQTIDQDDTKKRFYGIDIPGKLSFQCPQFFDEVFALRVFEKEDEKIRRLLTSEADNYIAKDRSGKLNEYEVCDLDAIKNKIVGG